MSNTEKEGQSFEVGSVYGSHFDTLFKKAEADFTKAQNDAAAFEGRHLIRRSTREAAKAVKRRIAQAQERRDLLVEIKHLVYTPDFIKDAYMIEGTLPNGTFLRLINTPKWASTNYRFVGLKYFARTATIDGNKVQLNEAYEIAQRYEPILKELHNIAHTRR